VHCVFDRYLVVIDDLWTMEAWNIIKCFFVENNRGSRVITSTRLEDVAQACCSSFHRHVYKIKPLNDVNSRILFHRRIFYTEDACPDELTNVSDEILRHYQVFLCGNYFGLQLEVNPALEWMRYVLNLGYNDLPMDIKTCMLSWYICRGF
jgi:disease resistance protein RPM1